MKKQVLKERGVHFAFIAAIFIPSLVMMKFQTSSLAVGLLAVSLVISLVVLVAVILNPHLKFLSWSILLRALLVTSLVLLHYAVSGIFVPLPQDEMRFISGGAGMMLVIAAAYFVALLLVRLNQNAVRRIIYSICFILFVNAILSLTGVDYLDTGTNKPTFLFLESSHFSIVSAFFLMYYVKLRFRGWLIALLTFLIYALFVESLTMLVAVLLVVTVCFKFEKVLIVLPILLFSLLPYINLEYFISRLLLLTNDSENISVLVLLQGWENALYALRDTNGWGIGFQQFGIAGNTGEFTDKINYFMNGDLNILDGGTTAAKLIGEFGLFGLILVVIMLSRSVKAFVVLKRINDVPDLFLLARCVEVGILIELFVRGLGYFSPSIFVYLTMYFCTRLNEFSQKHRILEMVPHIAHN